MRQELVCLQFKNQLIEVYKTRGIVAAFMAYLGFVRNFATDIRYTQFTDWQIDDMVMCVYNDKIDPNIEVLETALSYTRRGGKSRKLTLLATFFTLLGYQVVWRAPHSDQLVQAAEWFSMNPFVSGQNIRYQSAVYVFGSPEISVAVLSEGRIASREASILIYDEGGTVNTWERMYEWYKNSRPMIAASKFKVIIHASTDAINTIFNEVLHILEEKESEYGTRFTSKHTWRDCPWITEAWIENEKKSHMDCSWYIDQNYNCIAVVRGGRVFTKIIEVNRPMYKEKFKAKLEEMEPTNGGVDFNGENVGHYIVEIAYDENNVYVIKETNFHDLFDLFKYEEISLELEDELFNTAFTDQTKRMGLTCIYQPWKKEIKAIRVQELCNRNIIIDKINTPLTYRNLQEAGYDPAMRLPTLAKRQDQHGLDCVLHAIHDVSGKIYVRSKPAARPLILGGRRRYNPLIRM